MKVTYAALTLLLLYAQGRASYLPKFNDGTIYLKAGNEIEKERTRPFNPSPEEMEKFTECLQRKNNAAIKNMGGKEHVSSEQRASIYRKCLDSTIPQFRKSHKGAVSKS